MHRITCPRPFPLTLHLLPSAFVGTYIYTPLQDRFPEESNLHFSAPFYVGSGLAVLAVILVFFFIPEVQTDGIEKMDREFFAYLAENGYDMSNIGLAGEGPQAAEEAAASGAIGRNNEK